MSELSIGARQAGSSPFNRVTMLWVCTVGVLAFIGMVVLGAYAPDLRSGRNGGTHALSNAGTGFSVLVRLAEATGDNPVVIRALNELESEDLAVITPDHGWTNLTDIMERRGARVTLLVLPKWETVADPRKGGWVRVSGLLPAQDPANVLDPALPLTVARRKTAGEPLRTLNPAAAREVHFIAPRVLQTISGKGLAPIITDDGGRIVLAKAAPGNTYILADPDLLNNHGMGSETQARAAIALLEFLNSTGAESIMFDVTANGLGRSRSPLKLAFDPPFLAVTLTIFAAMLLAAIQSLVRFGSPRRPERAIAFGKTALVDNSAALIRKAGREARLGARYVDLIRDRAAALFNLPPGRGPEALDPRLEALNPRSSFTQLATAATEARNREQMLLAAQSLNRWLEEVKG